MVSVPAAFLVRDLKDVTAVKPETTTFPSATRSGRSILRSAATVSRASLRVSAPPSTGMTPCAEVAAAGPSTTVTPPVTFRSPDPAAVTP